MLSHSQLWRGAACVGKTLRISGIFSQMSCLLCFNLRPDALGTGYNLWCPVSASSFFLPLNTFTRPHRLISKEISIRLMLGNLLCPTPDLCFTTPTTLMKVKQGALSHSLEVMSWTSHFPHGYGDEMTQWCFLLFMLGFSFYCFNKDRVTLSLYL